MLLPQTLFEIVRSLNQKPDWDLIYTDEDQVKPNGKRHTPFFKPDWSPHLLLSFNYIHCFWIVRTSLFNQAGGLRLGFEWNHDLLLRITERTHRIGHLPQILYSHGENKGHFNKGSKKAIENTLERRAIHGTVENGFEPFGYRVRHALTKMPKVSIIIPTRDRFSFLRSCIESIEQETTYKDFEIIVVDNNSTDPALLRYLRQSPYRVLKYSDPFNYARINNFAVAHAVGDVLLFLNNDTHVISPQWIEAMLEQAQQPDVGGVGVKLLFPDQTIQHAGVIVGPKRCHHAFYAAVSTIPNCFAQSVREVSAVTAACMMISKSVFHAVCGFDERFKVGFNDIDLCMRIREKGYRIIYTPYAVLYHYESVTRGKAKVSDDWNRFEERWDFMMKQGDPFYNLNLSTARCDFSHVNLWKK